MDLWRAPFLENVNLGHLRWVSGTTCSTLEMVIHIKEEHFIPGRPSQQNVTLAHLLPHSWSARACGWALPDLCLPGDGSRGLSWGSSLCPHCSSSSRWPFLFIYLNQKSVTEAGPSGSCQTPDRGCARSETCGNGRTPSSLPAQSPVCSREPQALSKDAMLGLCCFWYVYSFLIFVILLKVCL